MSMEGSTNRYHSEQAALGKIYEGVEKEVKKMTLKDVVWEINELTSNQKLAGKVVALIETTYRAQGINNTIDGLLEELFCFKVEDDRNICIFITHLNLEQEVRKMLIETMYDRQASEYEEGL